MTLTLIRQENLGLFIIVTAKEVSSLWACPGSHVSVYRTVVVKAGKHTVYGAGDNCTAISICSIWVLAAREPGVERVSQIRVSCQFHTK